MAGETQFWSWLSGARKQLRDALHMHRVENTIGAGMPDVEGFYDLAQFWAELKQEDRPKRASTALRFDLRKRERQIEWLRKRWELGANCFWLLRVKGDPVADDAGTVVYMLPGDQGHILKEPIMESELAVLCVHAGGRIFTSRNKPHQIIEGLVSCRRKPTSRYHQ